jgi:FG-GAP-like repeat
MAQGANMTARSWIALIPILAALIGVMSLSSATESREGLAADDAKSAISWKKTVVDKRFRSEGVAIADVNKDGKMDILAGDIWYEAPDWKIHEIRKVGDYGNGLSTYSECMLCWADDINGDGWPDQIVIGFPGKPAYWYENPQGKDVHWKEHVIWPSACNETPQYVDLFGTGKRVLVMGWQPPGKENMGQMAWFAPGKDPTQPWEMHAISVPSEPGKEVPGTQRYSHGLGVGDVNGDGRLDVICTGGWWEQPPEASSPSASQKPWQFHPAKLGEPCADMFAYDLDGDGKADIISSSAHKFGIWWHQQRLGNGADPAFLTHDLFPDLFSESHAMHCVDINGDGLKDLVTGKRWWSHGRNEPGSDKPAVLYWFEAKRDKDGIIKFTPHLIDSDSGIGTQFVVDDFNGDKLPDIIVANKKGVFIFEQVRKE